MVLNFLLLLMLVIWFDMFYCFFLLLKFFDVVVDVGCVWVCMFLIIKFNVFFGGNC